MPSQVHRPGQTNKPGPAQTMQQMRVTVPTPASSLSEIQLDLGVLSEMNTPTRRWALERLQFRLFDGGVLDAQRFRTRP